MRTNFKSSGSQKKNGTIASPRTLASLMVILLPAAGESAAVANSGYDLIYTDSQAAILKADPVSGSQMVVAQGQKLVQPLGIAVGAGGEIFLTDTGCGSVIGLNPRNGKQRVVASGAMMGMPCGIAVEANGDLLIANAQNLVRVAPRTGAQSIASSGQFFMAPLAVAVAADGGIYVVDGLGAVIHVDPATGQQMLVTSGNLLHRPQGIAVAGTDIYVTDVATEDGNFGVGRIVHVDARTGEQAVLSEGQNLVGPVGITLGMNGQLIVGDPYTINEQSPDLFDGAILSVDASTGEQTLICRGEQSYVNPRCVAVVPTHGTAH